MKIIDDQELVPFIVTVKFWTHHFQPAVNFAETAPTLPDSFDSLG